MEAYYLRALRDRWSGKPVSSRQRDNVRDGLVRLFRFARERTWLPEDRSSAAERIARVATGGEVSTLKPAELASVLNWFAKADRDWLPWAALAAFAGLRTSEIFRLEWSALKWTAGTIAIPRSVAKKVRIARKAPLLPCLMAWLEPWKDATGPVIPAKWKNLNDGQQSALARLKRAMGWTIWKHNVLRHSFGSHRLAIVKSEAQVALEMGNSPAQIRENYNDPKDQDDAALYFSVVPSASVRNVIPLPRKQS